MEGQELLGDIVIHWNESYDALQGLFERSTTQERVRKIEEIMPQLDSLVTMAASAFDEHNTGRVGDQDFAKMMAKWEATARELSREAGSKKLSPVECTNANSVFQQLVTTAHNIFVPWASWGRVKRY